MDFLKPYQPWLLSLLRAVAGLGTALVTCGARDPGLPRLAARLGAA